MAISNSELTISMAIFYSYVSLGKRISMVGDSPGMDQDLDDCGEKGDP